MNTLAPRDRLAPLDLAATSARIEPYRQGEPVDLRAAALIGVLTLLAADALIVFALAGGSAQLAPRRDRARFRNNIGSASGGSGLGAERGTEGDTENGATETGR